MTRHNTNALVAVAGLEPSAYRTRGCRQRRGGGAGLDVGEDLCPLLAADVPATGDDGVDLLGVADVGERIGVHDQQVRELSVGDCANRITEADERGGVACRGLDRLHRSEAAGYEQS